MGKKKVKNRYDVQVGDIFSKNSENSSYSIFLQVVALHGKTKVDVRELRQRCIEFDGHYKGIVPLPDNWVWDRERILTVREREDKLGVVFKNVFGYQWVELDRTETHMYMELHEDDDCPFYFRDYCPEIAEQLDLKTGLGVYAVSKPLELEWFINDDDCHAIIRYPDGREDETVFRELMRYDKVSQEQGNWIELFQMAKDFGYLWNEQEQIMVGKLISRLNKSIKDK